MWPAKILKTSWTRPLATDLILLLPGGCAVLFALSLLYMRFCLHGMHAAIGLQNGVNTVSTYREALQCSCNCTSEPERAKC